MNRRGFFGLGALLGLPNLADPAVHQRLDVTIEGRNLSWIVRLHASEQDRYRQILEGVCGTASMVKSQDTGQTAGAVSVEQIGVILAEFQAKGGDQDEVD